MTDADLDQEPVGTGTDPTVGTDKAPASAPPPDAGHDADLAELDLLDDAGEEGADTGEPRAAEAVDTDTDRLPWQRPAELEGAALAEWKEAQGLPTDAAGYAVKLDLRQGETITETGQLLIDGLKNFAVENDLPPPAVNGLVKWYDIQVKAQQAKLAEADEALRTETKATLQERWGDSYADRMAIANEGARVLPKAFREALKVARTPDGRSISRMPELAQALFEIGRLRTRKGNPVPPSDEARLAQITQVMNTDIDKYQREGLDKEYLALMRRRDASQTRSPIALSAAEEAEARELTQLMQTDIDTYAHRPYRGTGRPAADRLLELQRKRAGEVA